MDRMPLVLVVATMDTKAGEVAYIQTCLNEAGVNASPHHINDPEFGDLLIDIVQSWIKN